MASSQGFRKRMRAWFAVAHSGVIAPFAVADTYAPARPRAAGSPIVLCAARRHGVWHVTRNNAFVGDYLTKEAADAAVSHAAEQIAARGDRVEVASAASA